MNSIWRQGIESKFTRGATEEESSLAVFLVNLNACVIYGSNAITVNTSGALPRPTRQTHQNIHNFGAHIICIHSVSYVYLRSVWEYI